MPSRLQETGNSIPCSLQSTVKYLHRFKTQDVQRCLSFEYLSHLALISFSGFLCLKLSDHADSWPARATQERAQCPTWPGPPPHCSWALQSTFAAAQSDAPDYLQPRSAKVKLLEYYDEDAPWQQWTLRLNHHAHTTSAHLKPPARASYRLCCDFGQSGLDGSRFHEHQATRQTGEEFQPCLALTNIRISGPYHDQSQLILQICRC